MNETTRYIPARPKQSDDAVIKYAAATLAERLADELPDSDQKDMAADLAKALRYESYDGYRLAKHLEDYCGWDVDAHVVSCLDGWHTYEAYQQFQRDWVKAYDVRPRLSLGTSVIYKDKAGKIVRVEAATGHYIVSCPSEGHTNTGGFVVPYEDVEVPRADPAVESGAGITRVESMRDKGSS